MNDAPAFEHITYRVEWVFMIGTIGDSEGRTWAKELVEEKRFATKAEAEGYRDTHPSLYFDNWKTWRTKNCYCLFAIVRQEVRTDPLADPRVVALVEAAKELEKQSKKAVNLGAVTGTHWTYLGLARMKMTAALAALRTGGDT